jgi:hypothetical protein
MANIFAAAAALNLLAPMSALGLAVMVGGQPLWVAMHSYALRAEAASQDLVLNVSKVASNSSDGVPALGQLQTVRASCYLADLAMGQFCHGLKRARTMCCRPLARRPASPMRRRRRWPSCRWAR